MHRRGSVPLPADSKATERRFGHEPVELGSLLAGQLLPQLAHTAGSEKRVQPPRLRYICAAELVMERVQGPRHSQAAGPCQLAHATMMSLEYIAPVELADTMHRWS